MAKVESRSGGCHCGTVRFEADLDLAKVIACNCSICEKRGALFSFIPASAFKLLSGQDSLKDYQFAQFPKKKIHHLFCSTCGVNAFSRGSTPDGSEMIAINVRFVDGIDLAGLSPEPFDGKSL